MSERQQGGFFMNTRKQHMSTEKLVIGAVLTALVIVLQFMGTFVRLGPFQISLVLIPIVIGAAKCGTLIGGWLGFVFGLVVLLNGDAAAFLAVNAAGTILTVLVKGTACGLAAGLAYRLLFKVNRILAVAAAAIVCPVVNTGIFLLGCLLFFMGTIQEWAGSETVAHYIVFGLVGGNFLVELASNLVLSPIVVRLLDLRKR